MPVGEVTCPMKDGVAVRKPFLTVELLPRRNWLVVSGQFEEIRLDAGRRGHMSVEGLCGLLTKPSLTVTDGWKTASERQVRGTEKGCKPLMSFADSS